MTAADGGDEKEEEAVHGGPSGAAAAAVAGAAAIADEMEEIPDRGGAGGAGSDDAGAAGMEQDDGEEAGATERQAQGRGGDDGGGGGGGTTADGGARQRQRQQQQLETSSQQQQQQRAAAAAEEAANPHRSLASALERWRARLAVGDGGKADDGGEEEAAGGVDEAEFVESGDGDGNDENELTALGAATEEQAAQAVAAHKDEPTEEATAAATGGAKQEEEEDEAAAAAAAAPAGGAQKGGNASAPPPSKDEEGEDDGEPVVAPSDGDGTASRRDGRFQGADEAFLGRSKGAPDALAADESELPQNGFFDPDSAAAGLQARLALELSKPAAERASGGSTSAAAAWRAASALTERTAAELSEALRAALEPTRASRLARGYRSGKRLDMRSVVTFVASGFRRDAIWCRRTRPDARSYQVVLAVDDSRSVADAGVAPFAAEALAALSRALARAELGDLAVVAFGGSRGARLLHRLGQPFDEAAGAQALAGLTFDADATLGDTPAADALAAAGAILDQGAAAAASAASSSSANAPVAQLVIVVGDGRFHEKAPLRRAVAELAARPGVLLVYVALDGTTTSGGGGGGGASTTTTPAAAATTATTTTSAGSLADLRTVSFGPDGRPTTSSYLDDFPFPHYVLLRDAAGLPRALGGLVRRWVDAAAASSSS